jgi:hypothetical protein
VEGGDDVAVECLAATVATNASAKVRRCLYAASHSALKMGPGICACIVSTALEASTPLSISTGDGGERCLGTNRLVVRWGTGDWGETERSRPGCAGFGLGLGNGPLAVPAVLASLLACASSLPTPFEPNLSRIA